MDKENCFKAEELNNLSITFHFKCVIRLPSVPQRNARWKFVF